MKRNKYKVSKNDIRTEVDEICRGIKSLHPLLIDENLKVCGIRGGGRGLVEEGGVEENGDLKALLNNLNDSLGE